MCEGLNSMMFVQVATSAHLLLLEDSLMSRCVVEAVRYMDIPFKEKLCQLCGCGEVENQVHIFSLMTLSSIPIVTPLIYS